MQPDPNLPISEKSKQLDNATARIHQLVAEVFDRRQELQKFQIDQARRRLDSAAQRVEYRNSIKEQIIERRVRQLLRGETTKSSRREGDEYGVDGSKNGRRVDPTARRRRTVAQTDVELAKLELEKAELTLDRLDRLRGENADFVSESELDEKRIAVKAAQLRLERAKLLAESITVPSVNSSNRHMTETQLAHQVRLDQAMEDLAALKARMAALSVQQQVNEAELQIEMMKGRRLQLKERKSVLKSGESRLTNQIEDRLNELDKERSKLDHNEWMAMIRLTGGEFLDNIPMPNGPTCTTLIESVKRVRDQLAACKIQEAELKARVDTLKSLQRKLDVRLRQ